MRSAFAVFLRGFTLPFGATTGRRIVFDGVAGTIQVYDSANRLRVFIGGASSDIELSTGAAAETNPAGLIALTFISGGETYRVLRVSSPSDASGSGDEEAQVELRSRSADGSEAPMVALQARLTTDDFRIGILDDSTGTRNQPLGTAVLVAGTVTVLHTVVAAGSRIVTWRQVAGGTLGHLSVGAITAGTSFVINSSSATDTSTVGYLILEPL